MASRYDPKGAIRQPLHHIAESADLPTEVRLGWAHEALAAGYDVNQMLQGSQFTRPHEPYPTRPLHMTVDQPGRKDDEDGEYISLKVIRLFLDHDADPRLMDYHNVASPMDKARELVCAAGKEDQEFGSAALKMMLEKAQELEDKEAAEQGRGSNDKWKREKEEVERWQQAPSGYWEGVKRYLGYGSNNTGTEYPLPGRPAETTKKRLQESQKRYEEAYRKYKEAEGRA